MSEYTLIPRPPLGGYQKNFDGATLEELIDLAIVSIAIPRGGEENLANTLRVAYGADLPKPVKASVSVDGATRFFGLGNDQVFAVFTHDGPDAVDIVAAKLNGCGYVTLQSDNWVTMRLSGPKSREALERICPIDLAPDFFPIGSAARTQMEHMGAIILLESEDTFVLLSASSSAESFLHALETSIKNVI